MTLKNNNLDERDKTMRKIIFKFINDQMNIDYNDDENFIHQNTSENAELSRNENEQILV